MKETKEDIISKQKSRTLTDPWIRGKTAIKDNRRQLEKSESGLHSR